MPIAVKPGRVMGAASLGMLLAIALALPGTASAATLTCRGHTEKAQDTEDYENAMDYVFTCAGRILGYMIVSDRELDAFDTEIEVHDVKGVIVPADGFACEGDIPGFGIGCFGSYSANNVVRGTMSVSGTPACTEPRVDAKLVVVAESLDTATGTPKKTSVGAMAGPFELGRPRKCPESTRLAGLLAQLGFFKAQYKAAPKPLAPKPPAPKPPAPKPAAPKP